MNVILTGFFFHRLLPGDVESHLHRKVKNIGATIMKLGGYMARPKRFPLAAFT